jgi:hypothetical protein
MFCNRVRIYISELIKKIFMNHKIFNRSPKIFVFLNLLQRAYVLLNPLIKGELGIFHLNLVFIFFLITSES